MAMKISRIVFIILLMFLRMTSIAQPLSEIEALNKAEQFWHNSVNSERNIEHKLELKVRGPETDSGSPLYYVFSEGREKGFVLVAGDQALGDIIGYSYDGAITDKMPDDLNWFLSLYRDKLDFVKKHNIKFKGKDFKRGKSSIKNLINSEWNQTSPYNDICPIGENGKRCYTGCVATALAQIMYYHKWPYSGEGEHSYTVIPDGDINLAETLTTDFAKMKIPWDMMLDSYKNHAGTEESRKAVAKLMLNIGIALEMNYGTSGSSPNYIWESDVLQKYFKYSFKVTNLQNINDSIFNDIVYKELELSRPVLVAGYDESGQKGHMFICDGYKEDGTFHFNWGWGGAYDGYFNPTCLIPVKTESKVSDYSYKQRIVYHIVPYRLVHLKNK